MNSTDGKNRVSFDLTGNDELKRHFAGKTPGDSCSVEVKFTFEGMQGDAATGVLESLAPDGYTSEPADGGPEVKEVEPDAVAPVSVSVGPPPPMRT